MSKKGKKEVSEKKDSTVEPTPSSGEEGAQVAPELQSLLDAANDINESLGFNVDMKKYQTEDALVGFLKKAFKQIVPQDTLKPETHAVLEKFGLKVKAPSSAETEPVEKSKPEKKAKAPKEEGAPSGSPKTPFGHRVSSKAGQIDVLLLEGGTVEDIGKKVGATDAYIRGHMSYLKSKKGAEIAVEGNVYTAKVK